MTESKCDDFQDPVKQRFFSPSTHPLGLSILIHVHRFNSRFDLSGLFHFYRCHLDLQEALKDLCIFDVYLVDCFWMVLSNHSQKNV